MRHWTAFCVLNSSKSKPVHIAVFGDQSSGTRWGVNSSASPRRSLGWQQRVKTHLNQCQGSFGVECSDRIEAHGAQRRHVTGGDGHGTLHLGSDGSHEVGAETTAIPNRLRRVLSFSRYSNWIFKSSLISYLDGLSNSSIPRLPKDEPHGT